MISFTRREFVRAGLVGGGVLAGAAAGSGTGVSVANAAPALSAGGLTVASLGLGFSANSGILWESAASRAQSFDFMKAVGATTIRIDIPWRWVEQQQGKPQWTLIDPVIDAARSRGISVLGVLTSTPQWAALGRSSNQQTRPADMSHWASFASKVAKRYAGKIFAYEIWNEPNGVEYFAPGPDPVAYAAMVRAAFSAIRGVDPAALVLAGALGPAPAGAAGMMQAVDFFEAMLAEGVGDVDAYSFHPYDDEQTMAEAAFWDGTAMRTAMRMHEMLRARGEGHKKIWATEYGAPSMLGTSRQTELVVNGMMQWAESGFAGPMYIHHHRDQDANDGYGLADQNLQPKEAAYGVQALAAQQFPQRWEAIVFASNADPALRQSTSPVFRQADGFAQEHVEGARYATPHGWISSPSAAATILRRANLLPLSTFANGKQDVAQTGGARIFSSEQGTWLVVGAILTAWTEAVGFPTGEQNVVDANTVTQSFANGTITWRRIGGTQVQITKR